MGLVSQVTRYIKGPHRMPSDQFGKAKPLRNPDAQETTDDDGNLILTFAVELDQRWLTRVVDRLSGTRATRDFVLEPIGTTVWRMCDGKTSVKTIAKRLCDEYKMNRLESETALAQYLHTLSQRGLITMLVPKK